MSIHNYLNATMSSFIGASINRVSITGDLCHRYRISGQDVKAAAQVQRLHDSAISEYLRNNFNVEVTYDKVPGVFYVTIDLTRAMLNPNEAEFLRIAMETFRQERT